MKSGMVHIYCGDGKGKTTAAMGMAVRAAGFGLDVLICQFMKDNRTSERKILEQIANISILNGLDEEKFSFQMTNEEKLDRRRFYTEQFKKAAELACTKEYDMLVLDEILYAVRAGFLDEDIIIAFLENRPDRLEVVMTGNGRFERLEQLADYISEIRKIKHPYDKGLKARKGIEK